MLAAAPGARLCYGALFACSERLMAFGKPLTRICAGFSHCPMGLSLGLSAGMGRQVASCTVSCGLELPLLTTSLCPAVGGFFSSPLHWSCLQHWIAIFTSSHPFIPIVPLQSSSQVCPMEWGSGKH